MKTAGTYLVVRDVPIKAYDRLWPGRLPKDGGGLGEVLLVDDFGHCEWGDTNVDLWGVLDVLIYICPDEPCIYTFPETASQPIRILALRRRNPIWSTLPAFLEFAAPSAIVWLFLSEFEQHGNVQ